MLPRADLTVSPVGRAEALSRLDTAGDPRQDAFQRSLAGLVGKSMQGEVLSRLTDGSFIVKVAGAAARMHLPPSVQVGAEVPLTLVSLTPRPTFQIGAGQAPLAYSEAGPPLLPGAPGRGATLLFLEGSAAQTPAGQAPAAQGDPALRTTSHAAALLSRAPIVPADQLPPIDPKSTPAVLSDAARAIASVLTTAMKTPNMPTAIVATTPLVAAGPVAPEHLAGALRDAIGKSGLFYESHLAEWSEGKRPITELLREPQMQRMMAGAEAGTRQAGTVETAAAQLMNLQLATHEQARVAWQGQAWPGQAMQWDIEKDTPERRGGDAEALEPAWRSGVRLRFPLLGDIAATFVMVGQQLHVQINAGTDDVGALLRERAGEFSSAMEAAGTPLSSLDIRAGQAEPDG